MFRRVLIAVAVVLSCVGLARAQETAGADPAPVATVLGKPITKADLKARLAASGEATTDPNWGAVTADIVFAALVERYLDENELRARDSEIDAYVKKTFANMDEAMRQAAHHRAAEMHKKIDAPGTPEDVRELLRTQVRQVERAAKGENWPDAEARAILAAEAAESRAKLDTPGLSAHDRATLERSIAYADRFQGLDDAQAMLEHQKAEKEMQREVAAPMIEWWKFNRSLFKKYGGRILFQQAGLEAFDATKTWLGEREKAGDFEILDTTLVPGFWDYYTRDQSAFLIQEPEGTEFDVPWWEQQEPAE